MKLTELRIVPKNTWNPPSEDNPLRAVIKISSEGTLVETVLSQEAADKMIALCAEEIAKGAKEQVDKFAAMSANYANPTELIEGEST